MREIKNSLNALFFINIFFITVLLSVIKQILAPQLGIAVSLPVFPLALLLCLLIDYFLSKKIRWKALTICSLALCLLLIASSRFDLYSAYDAASYHKPGIDWLFSGKNLLTDLVVGKISYWTIHYPKATWIFSGELCLFLGNFTCFNAYHLIISAALFTYCLSFFDQLNFSKVAAIAFAFFLTFNPVSISQSFSSYLDGTFGALSIIVLLSVVLFVYNHQSVNLWIFLISSSLVINLKFSGFLVVAIAFMYLGLSSFFATNKLQDLIQTVKFFSFFVVLGILILGFNPYVTHLVKGEHLFHPLFGNDKIDIMTSNTPKYFREKSSLEQFYYSSTAQASNDLQEEYRFKNILDPDIGGVKLLARCVDTRWNGFGSYFYLTLIIGLGLLISNVRSFKDVRVHLLILTIFTVFLNPEAWWARYSVPIFLLPLLYLCQSNENETRFKKVLMFVVLIPLLFQTSIQIYSHMECMFDEQKHLDYLRNQVMKDKISIPDMAPQFIFKHLGVEYEIYNSAKYKCTKSEQFEYSFRVIEYCKTKNLIRISGS